MDSEQPTLARSLSTVGSFILLIAGGITLIADYRLVGLSIIFVALVGLVIAVLLYAHRVRQWADSVTRDCEATLAGDRPQLVEAQWAILRACDPDKESEGHWVRFDTGGVHIDKNQVKTQDGRDYIGSFIESYISDLQVESLLKILHHDDFAMTFVLTQLGRAMRDQHLREVKE